MGEDNLRKLYTSRKTTTLKLIHYTSDIIEGPYRIPKNPSTDFKPHGLWVSDDDTDYGWADWCRAEDFRLESLQYAYRVTLREPNNVLIISTPESLKRFGKTYKHDGPAIRFSLDWEAVAQQWDGLIITPYQSECRLELDHLWYNIWDCASGCIWNLDIVEMELDTCQNIGST
jgi:hypothetical protein